MAWAGFGLTFAPRTNFRGKFSEGWIMVVWPFG
jgi:hypothetical protein